jgi:FtsP/CotA-like multicopper oxidase with cupredoxin domain
MELTRRDVLRWGIVVGGGALLSGGRQVSSASDLPRTPFTVTAFKDQLPIAPVKQPAAPFPTTVLPTPTPASVRYFVVDQTLVASHQFHQSLPPVLNALWGYDGQIPGPTFVVQGSGTAHVVRFVNHLEQGNDPGFGEPISAIHRHGGFQLPEHDGHPVDTFANGQFRDYFFPNRPDADLDQNEHSTNWYHDHSLDVTGPNVYRGLAGFYLYRNRFDTGKESDPSPNLGLPGKPDGQVPIPGTKFDVPLVFQDKLFDANSIPVYDTFDHNGFIGDQFLVNGKIQPNLDVVRRRYRFRCLNGSNARVYQFFLVNEREASFPVLAIATDDNLLERATSVPSFRLAPAERVEIVVDFRNFKPGEYVYLENRLAQTDGRKPDGLVSRGTRILRFHVTGDPAPDDQDEGNPALADGFPLLPLDPHETPDVLRRQVKIHRTFEFERSEGAWVINGRFFDPANIDAEPRLREPEIWTLKSGGGWVHPVHIHLSSFFVLSRDGKTPPVLEQGRKDTVLIGGDVGQTVQILIKFEDPRFGATNSLEHPYVFHCHNIEHEDMRMMGQFRVVP